VIDHAIGTWTHLQLFGEFFPLLRDSVINFDAIAVIAGESFYERMTNNASRLDWGAWGERTGTPTRFESTLNLFRELGRRETVCWVFCCSFAK
jgi:hypothetical protein